MVGLEHVDSLKRDYLACILAEQSAAGVIRWISVTGIPDRGTALRYTSTAPGELGSEQVAQPVVEGAAFVWTYGRKWFCDGAAGRLVGHVGVLRDGRHAPGPILRGLRRRLPKEPLEWNSRTRLVLGVLGCCSGNAQDDRGNNSDERKAASHRSPPLLSAATRG